MIVLFLTFKIFFYSYWKKNCLTTQWIKFNWTQWTLLQLLKTDLEVFSLKLITRLIDANIIVQLLCIMTYTSVETFDVIENFMYVTLCIWTLKVIIKYRNDLGHEFFRCFEAFAKIHGDFAFPKIVGQLINNLFNAENEDDLLGGIEDIRLVILN